ncbi:hypothetical protein CHLRE_09g407350v5 [Chlamydomonas reinhardtii]|uniref:SOUL heme-binding protein n=1 Tax=Chlamydomonas reinhardtii TaxID=3055 RepID=A0A2K3DFC8_CHLRE|nr:uncharacterized protein CHLRE_09g407350v5 [Chlamydomonas reinhardtii]PNW79241.1 hypothetical protein CHLRE_09g407350v5 [Chlamydomonas reinhardtii]
MALAATRRPAAALLLLLPILLLLTACGGFAAAQAQQQRLQLSPLTESELVQGLATSLAAATPSAKAFAGDAAAADEEEAEAGGGLGPVLCDTLDCPNFKVLDRYEGGVELRRYDPASFVSTVLSLDEEGCIEKAAVAGFQRLIKYNFGDNEDEKKVPMTAPVLYALDVDRKASSRRALRWRDRFSVSFFLPFRYQGSSRSPPRPSNPDVFLVDVREVDVFIRAFDGFATASRIGRVASAFIRDLHDAGHKIDCRTVYVAQYSPPFQPVFRYNEVWILRRRRGRKTSGGDEPVDPSDVDPDQPEAPYDDDDDDDDPARGDGVEGEECGAWLDGDAEAEAAGQGGDGGGWLQAVAA